MKNPVQNEELISELLDHFPIGVMFSLPWISKWQIIYDKPVFQYTPAELDLLNKTLNTTLWDFVLSEEVNLGYLISFIIVSKAILSKTYN